MIYVGIWNKTSRHLILADRTISVALIVLKVVRYVHCVCFVILYGLIFFAISPDDTLLITNITFKCCEAENVYSSRRKLHEFWAGPGLGYQESKRTSIHNFVDHGYCNAFVTSVMPVPHNLPMALTYTHKYLWMGNILVSYLCKACVDNFHRNVMYHHMLSVSYISRGIGFRKFFYGSFCQFSQLS